MPIYSTKCKFCGSQKDIFRSIKKRNDDLPECCGKLMYREICAPSVISDIDPYKSMVTGEMITSRSNHKEHLMKHKLVEIGNEKPDFKNLEPSRDLKKDLHEIFTGYGY